LNIIKNKNQDVKSSHVLHTEILLLLGVGLLMNARLTLCMLLE